MNLNLSEHVSDVVSCGETPVLVLSQQVLLPHTSIPWPHLAGSQLDAIEAATSNQGWIVVTQREPSQGHQLRNADAAGIGCLAKVSSHAEPSNERNLTILKGISRVRFRSVASETMGIPVVRYEQLRDRLSELPPDDRIVLRRELVARLFEFCPELAVREMSLLLESELSLGHLCDLAVEGLQLSFAERVDILRETNVDARCRSLLAATLSGPCRPREALPKSGVN